MVEVHHHRSKLKQTNKPFKSRHATKSEIKRKAKGKTASVVSIKSNTASKTAAQLKLNRKHTAKQVQAKKREALLAATRIFNGVDGTPRVVAVVPLSEDVNGNAAISALASALDADTTPGPDYGTWRLRADRFKTSLQFINLPYRNFYAALDACKVADYVLFVLSTDVEVDSWGELLLRTLQAQGLPQVVSCVVSPKWAEVVDQKSRAMVLKSLLSFIHYFVPSQARIYDLDVLSVRINAVRALCEGRPSEVRWREGRTWMLAENVNREEGGSLCVTGYVRGAKMSPNRLVHIPGHGDFQVEKIVSAPMPRHSRLYNKTTVMEVEAVVLAERVVGDADSLVSTNVPDDMENEQTWPTEEEMQEGDGHGLQNELHPDAIKGTTPRRIKRVPKGTSEYQAAWIIDDDEFGDDDEADEAGEQEHAEMEDAAGNNEELIEGQAVGFDEDEDLILGAETMSVVGKSVAFQDLDPEEEERQLDEWRSRRKEEADEDQEFPDEIDTPKEIPARIRFQRYRGLRSFRTSPWDPFENLPRDYARIFQFENFRRTEKNVTKQALIDELGVQPGVRVSIYLRDVPKDVMDNFDPLSPFTLFGLLKHEHKVTTLHFTVQRNTEYTESVRSKDPLILCVGPRRLRTNPIYSQHTRGGGKGANNVHKFERWLRPSVTCVATTYGPVLFGKQPCALLRESGDPQCPHLVAMGSFLNTDTTRIITKRIVLTGHPFKIHKKTSTVRYMFFNNDDVMYFKPIQLHTKYGRIGHIQESLGTHGYFKAHFDGPVTQMDTICMSLYKRIYPRWASAYNIRKGGEATGPQNTQDENAMEE